MVNRGEQEKTKESNPIKDFLRMRIEAARTFFEEETDHRAADRHALEPIIARCLLTAEESTILSSNFRSIIDHLGQYVAGDEKLYGFTGKSCDVRLVISKPDRVGLWFYELCGVLENGLPLRF